jgi:hypothetical protein
LGTLLLQILTRNGVLAKVAALKDPQSHGSEALRQGKRQKELVKTVAGRLWNSAVHLVMLHVLFWEAVLHPPTKIRKFLADTKYSLSLPPVCKVIDMADRIERLLEHFTKAARLKKKSIGSLSIKSAQVSLDVEQHLYECYSYLGYDQAPAGRTVHLMNLYVPFMLAVGHIRKDGPKLTKEMEGSIIDSSYDLLNCVMRCEKFTTYLMDAVAENTVELAYLKYFGTLIFDRQYTSEYFRERYSLGGAAGAKGDVSGPGTTSRGSETLVTKTDVMPDGQASAVRAALATSSPRQ